jgi:hypothetical protein
MSDCRSSLSGHLAQDNAPLFDQWERVLTRIDWRRVPGMDVAAINVDVVRRGSIAA